MIYKVFNVSSQNSTVHSTFSFFEFESFNFFKVIFTECLFPYHIQPTRGNGSHVFFPRRPFKKNKQPGKTCEEAWGNPWKWWCFLCFFQPAKPPTTLEGCPKNAGGFGLPIPALQQRQALAAAKAAGEAGGFFQGFLDPKIAGGVTCSWVFFVGGRGIEFVFVGLWLDFWLFEFVLAVEGNCSASFLIFGWNSWKTSGLEFCFKTLEMSRIQRFFLKDCWFFGVNK